MAQMKEQNKTPEKELNKMEISNLSDPEFKTLVVRMLKELNEYFNSIRKDPDRNEDYTKWNKEKFTGNQQWSDEAKNQTNDLEHKEEKKNIPSEQQEGKRIQKNPKIG